MKILILALLCLPFTLIAQEQSRKIEFPDIPGYETLICNLLQHTVFSDGSVWPDIRVREATYDDQYGLEGRIKVWNHYRSDLSL